MQQDYILEDIRASLVLTNAYVAGIILGPNTGNGANPALRNQLNLLIDFTKGSLTSAQIKIEYSHDGVNWYQDTFVNISGATGTAVLGEYSFAADGKYVISSPIKFSYIRVSAKGTGTVTGSLMKIQGVVGTV